jgi:hypothetical protein
MRYLAALFAICCQGGSAQPLQPTAPVTVFLTGSSVPAAVLQGLERATESAFAPSGVKLSWMEGRLPDTGVDGRLVVVRLEGQCRSTWPDSAKPLTTRPAVLAQTHIADGRVLPFADVLCDAVRQLVAADLKAAAARDRDGLFGRALGRVAAHELYHILLRTTEHTHTALSRAEQSAPDLLTSQAAFSSDDEQRISQALSSGSDNLDTGGR